MWTMNTPGQLPEPNYNQPFVTAAEHSNIVNHVKNSVQALTSIVNVLEGRGSDTSIDFVDLIYTEEDVLVLNARTRECAKNMLLASDTASRWMQGVEKRLQVITSDKKANQDKLDNLQAQKAASEVNLTALQSKATQYDNTAMQREKEAKDAETAYNKANDDYNRAVKRIEDRKNHEKSCVGIATSGITQGYYHVGYEMGNLYEATERNRAKGLMDERKAQYGRDQQSATEVRSQYNTEKTKLDNLQRQMDTVRQDIAALIQKIAPVQKEVDDLSALSVCPVFVFTPMLLRWILSTRARSTTVRRRSFTFSLVQTHWLRQKQFPISSLISKT